MGGGIFVEVLMIVKLDEMKQYLRVDYSDEDALLTDIIAAATSLCMDVARTEDEKAFKKDKNAKIAIMYAVAYLYEHREEADHEALTLSLRSLLSGIRKEGF